MQCVQKCEFRISNVPENTSFAQICAAFVQFHQLKEFRIREVSPKVFVISMESPTIAEIEDKCAAVAEANNLTLTWMESQGQVAVIDAGIDERTQQKTQMWNSEFVFHITAEDATVLYEIYCEFSKIGQVNKFSSMNPDFEDDHVCDSYHMSVRTADIVELESQSERISRQFGFKIEWKNSRKLDEGKNEENVTVFAPPDQESPKNVLNALNDDCLRVLFNRPEIDMIDLAVLANTCKRFKTIATEAITKRTVDDHKQFDQTALWRMEVFFRTFGKQIKTVYLDEIHGIGMDILSQIQLKHCTNVTKLTCSMYYEQSRNALRRLLPQLHELTIMRANEHISQLFDENAVCELKKLHFIEYSILLLPRFRMPQLVDLRLDPADSPRSFNSSDAFFSLNPQIEILSIGHLINDFDYARTLGQLVNIKELELDERGVYIDGISNAVVQLGQLKTVRLRVHMGLDLLSFLKALHESTIELENIALHFIYDGVVELFINSICRFKNITCLEIRCVRSSIDDNVEIQGNDCLTLAQELNKLEKIHFENVNSLQAIHDALTVADRLKKAYFSVIIVFEDAPEALGSHMAAIDAIRREKGIELRVEISVSYRPNAERLVKVLQC